MHILISLGIAVVSTMPPQSPFNSYNVFLTPRKLPGTCAGHDREQFKNRTYTFGGDVYPSSASLTLRDGEFVERNPFGTVEWETSLVSVEPLKVAGRQATLLVIGSNHVNGSGGATHVLVVDCRNRELMVWFEAGGEGIRDASFTEADQNLRVSRWVWSRTDAHCCPSGKAEEHYRWRPGGPFVRVTSSTR
jgi:hypothetical protein